MSEPSSIFGGPCGRRKVPFQSQAESCWPLQTFLSGGKRYASPLSARSSPAGPAQEPAGGAHPAAAAIQQKGLSFADLVGVKGRRSSLSGKKPGRPGAQKSHCFGAPATLTVGMVLTGPVGGKATPEKPAPDAPMDKLPAGEPAEGVAVAESAARETPCIQPAEPVPVSANGFPGYGSAEGGAAELGQSKNEAVQEGNAHSGPDDAREGPSSSELEEGLSQDQPGVSLEQVKAIPSLKGKLLLVELRSPFHHRMLRSPNRDTLAMGGAACSISHAACVATD